MVINIKSKYFRIIALIGWFIIPILVYQVLLNFAKHQIDVELTGISVEFESTNAYEAELFLTPTGRFADGFKISPEVRGNTTHFDLTEIDVPNKRFRLDFKMIAVGSHLKIKNLFLETESGVKVFDQDAVFENIILHSPSIQLNKQDNAIQTRMPEGTYDPYLIFSPLLKMIFPIHFYIGVLLFFLIGAMLFVFNMFWKPSGPLILNVLLAFFIVCIPLKIAWTTFVTLLLLFYVLTGIVRNKVFSKGQTYKFLLSIFVFSIMLGRPTSLREIDLILAYLIFAIISFGSWDKSLDIAKHYFLVFFFVLCGGIVVTGMNLLLSFNDFFGGSPLMYFENIKVFGVYARDWLIYDHPAFLSFFGLVGLIFCHESYKKREVQKWFYILYSLILLLALIILGSRIGILIYIIFQSNLLFGIKGRWFVPANLMALIIFSSFLIFTIPKIDSNRNYLWKTSIEAIEQRPWLGYGISNSEKVLNDQRIYIPAGFKHSMNFNHSHNQFLTFLLENGILGSLILLILVIFGLFRFNFLSNRYFVLYLFGLGYIFLTESILQTSKPIYTLCFVFLLFAYKQENIKRISDLKNAV